MENRKLIWQISLFLIFVSLILISQVFFSDWKFYYDSLDYWTYADEFVKNNTFSLLNYDQPLRGYLFPLILFVIKQTSKIFLINDYFLFFIFYSLFISFVVVFVIPSLTQKIFKLSIKPLQIIIFFALFFFFWNGYFNYPMTDIISFFLILISLSFYLRFKTEKKSTFYFLILSGLFLFSAAQLRPAYLILILALLLTFFIYIVFKKNSRVHCLITIIGLIIGMGIVSAPQIYINKNLYGTLNPLAETSKSKIIGGTNLYIYQLRSGIRIQKYETNIGTNEFESAHASFLDNEIQGQRLYKELREKKNTGMFNIIKIIVFNIGDFIMIYSRHLFNGLDIWYNTPYVKNLYTKTRYVISFFNYTLIFLFFIFLFENKGIFQKKEVKLGLLIYFVPIIFVIPTTVEVRFFLPFFIFLYLIISYFDVLLLIKNNFKSFISNYWLKYIIFMLICFILSQYTFSFLKFK